MIDPVSASNSWARDFLVSRGGNFDLDSLASCATHRLPDKGTAKKDLEHVTGVLRELQSKLWAANYHSVLIVLQGMDASGKDGIIRHVMRGVNPLGCSATAFGPPGADDLRHHFLWRPQRYLPPSGHISIFNRSYYEEVLVVRVRPEILRYRKLFTDKTGMELWHKRYEDINAFEHHLYRNGTCVIKFFLNVSADEQRKRLLKRIDDPLRHWKFSPSDVDDRALWTDFRLAYRDMLQATSTDWAPWYVIPSDHKWYARSAVAHVITERISELNPQYPMLPKDHLDRIEAARKVLLSS